MKTKTICAIAIPAAAVAVTVAAMGIVIVQRGKTIHEMQQTIAEKQTAEPAETTAPFYDPVPVNHHYDLAGEKILLRDDTFGQIWIPVLADVPLSRHPLEQMEMLRSGRMISYDKDGMSNALTGVDLSVYNVVSDWDAVKADGIDFVMLRVGYRGYGTGAMKSDDSFRANYNAAKNAGLMVGAYFFSQAITEEEAVEEAVYAAELLEGCALDFPVAYDWELIFHDNDSRTSNVPVETLTDCCLAFCQNMEAFGYQTMIYQNKRTSLFKLDLPRLKGIPFWLAEYGDGPTYIYDYDMWQYSCTGEVDGIAGDVDLNLCFCDFSQEGAPEIRQPVPEGIEHTVPTEATTTTTVTTTTETAAPAADTTGTTADTADTSETTTAAADADA